MIRRGSEIGGGIWRYFPRGHRNARSGIDLHDYVQLPGETTATEVLSRLV